MIGLIGYKVFLDCVVFWLDVFVFIVEVFCVFVYDNGKGNVIEVGYDVVVEFWCFVINCYSVVLGWVVYGVYVLV